MGGIQINEEKISLAAVKKIIDAVSSVRFGSVEIIVHDSKVVRIEKTEKFLIEDEDASKKYN